ncbi:MAG: hydroxymethylglutaryl-CoA lyase [Pseudomonadota bacterium]
MNSPAEVTVVEVGPRDGLQNEAAVVPLAAKLRLIRGLDDAGCPRIEVGSFVSPRWVPQMADTEAVVRSLPPTRARLGVLVPNTAGLDTALASGTAEIAVFAACSETFSKRNVNASIDVSIQRLEKVIGAVKAAGRFVRAYLSCVVACPYEGPIAPTVAARLGARLMAAGADELSLGDTIGRATPRDTRALLAEVGHAVPIGKLAWHGHDTYGQALVNALTALDGGVTVVDASVAGLGGCPYAPGAAGNLASEDLVFMLDGMGVRTGIDLEALARAGSDLCAALGRPSESRVARALGATDKR